MDGPDNKRARHTPMAVEQELLYLTRVLTPNSRCRIGNLMVHNFFSTFDTNHQLNKTKRMGPAQLTQSSHFDKTNDNYFTAVPQTTKALYNIPHDNTKRGYAPRQGSRLSNGPNGNQTPRHTLGKQHLELEPRSSTSLPPTSPHENEITMRQRSYRASVP